MKKLLVFLALALSGCSTAQVATTRAVTDPLVAAAISGYAQTYGVPPVLTTALVTPLQNEFWGMYLQVLNQQPIAAGSTVSAIGNAVAAKIPASADQPTKLALLTAAINTLEK